MEVKAWVKDARVRLKMTGSELGEMVGVSKAAVGHWETGQHQPSYQQMVVIRNASGLPMPHELGAPEQPDLKAIETRALKLALEVAELPEVTSDGRPKGALLAWLHTKIAAWPALDSRTPAAGRDELGLPHFIAPELPTNTPAVAKAPRADKRSSGTPPKRGARAAR